MIKPGVNNNIKIVAEIVVCNDAIYKLYIKSSNGQTLHI